MAGDVLVGLLPCKFSFCSLQLLWCSFGYWSVNIKNKSLPFFCNQTSIPVSVSSFKLYDLAETYNFRWQYFHNNGTLFLFYVKGGVLISENTYLHSSKTKKNFRTRRHCGTARTPFSVYLFCFIHYWLSRRHKRKIYVCRETQPCQAIMSYL